MVRLSIKSTPEDVLAFWFGADELDDRNSVAYLQAGWERWFFGKDLLFDIAQWEATALIEHAASDAFDDAPAWAQPRAQLARILLLDQFTRCAYRGSAAALSHDVLACQLARQLFAQHKAFSTLMPVERFFVCLALSHAEDIEDNRLHVQIAEKLTEGFPSDSPTRRFFERLPGFPYEHFDTIQRFGRFPHRNKLLGRATTEAEAAWLASPACPGWARSQHRAILSYWDGRGLGDPVRFLLEFCLIPYDECPVHTREAFNELRSSGKLAFNQVPLLEMDDVPLVQTQAILRYVAGKKGLRGTTAAHEAFADMVVNGVLDARMPLITARFSNDPRAAIDKFESVTLPQLGAHLERMLRAHGGDYICAAGLTYADVVLLEFLCYAADECDAALERILCDCPRLLAHHHRMSSFGHMKAYLGSDRRKPTPDAAFVRRTCAILDIPCPAHAQLLHADETPTRASRWSMLAVGICAAAMLVLARQRLCRRVWHKGAHEREP